MKRNWINVRINKRQLFTCAYSNLRCLGTGIANWLTDRRQRVVVDREVSSCKSVLSGVPQVSVLGPILFLVCAFPDF